MHHHAWGVWLQVFRCLVESCSKLFCTPAERRQHLIDHHKYSAAFRFDTLHLGGVSIIAETQQRMPSKGIQRQQQGMRSGAADDIRKSAGLHAGISERGDKCAGSGSTDMDMDSLTEGVSKLSTAGHGGVSSSVSFGRRGRALVKGHGS